MPRHARHGTNNDVVPIIPVASNNTVRLEYSMQCNARAITLHCCRGGAIGVRADLNFQNKVEKICEQISVTKALQFSDVHNSIT